MTKRLLSYNRRKAAQYVIANFNHTSQSYELLLEALSFKTCSGPWAVNMIAALNQLKDVAEAIEFLTHSGYVSVQDITPMFSLDCNHFPSVELGDIIAYAYNSNSPSMFLDGLNRFAIVTNIKVKEDGKLYPEVTDINTLNSGIIWDPQGKDWVLNVYKECRCYLLHVCAD